MNSFETVLLEEHRYLQAAAAVVADRHHILVALELVDPAGHLAHRDVLCAFDTCGVPLPLLAHVEEDRVLSARVGEPRRELRRADVFQKRNLGARSAFTSGGSMVSKRSVLVQAPVPLAVIRRAVITGGSPTTAKSRPPGASCSANARGTSGVEPVSTITS